MNRSVPRLTVGTMLLFIAGIHTLFGILAGLGALPSTPGVEASAPLLEIVHDGVFDAVERTPMRMAIAWFLFTGFALAIAGLVARDAELSGHAPGRALGWSLGAFSLLGVVTMPVSGFWLGFVPAAVALRRATVSSSITAP